MVLLSTTEEKSKNHPSLSISALFYFTYSIFDPREIFHKDEEPFLYSSLRTTFKNPMLTGLLELPLHDPKEVGGGAFHMQFDWLKTMGDCPHFREDFAIFRKPF